MVDIYKPLPLKFATEVTAKNARNATVNPGTLQAAVGYKNGDLRFTFGPGGKVEFHQDPLASPRGRVPIKYDLSVVEQKLPNGGSEVVVTETLPRKSPKVIYQGSNVTTTVKAKEVELEIHHTSE